MTPADVIALFDDPKTLLRRCYLHIAGGATRTPKLPDLPLPPANGQAVVATFKIETGGHQTVRGFTTGVSGKLGKTKERAFVKLTKLSGLAKAALAADEFNAYYVPMVQTADVIGGTSHYTLPTGPGALAIMITSKLSGCTFGVGSDAMGAVLVSHVQPDTAIKDDDQRAHSLRVAVGSGFTSVDGQFRMKQEYEDYGAVIGRRTGNKWKFYLQASSKGSKADYAISKVEVID